MEIDDLKVGELIAIMQYKRSVHRPFSFFVESHHTEEEWEWTSHGCGGEPLEVVAISLPFLVVANPAGQRSSMDSRHFRFTRLDRKYAKALQERGLPETKARRKESQQEAVESRRCGRCGQGMIQRLMEAGTGKWGLVCPNCDGKPRKALALA